LKNSQLIPEAAHRRQPKRRSSSARPGPNSASSDLSDVGANRPFAGMAFDKMRRPGDPTHAQHAGVESVSRSFHAHREPQQSTRFGPPRNSSFSRSKDGTILMRLPSARGGACAPAAATSLKLTRVGSCAGRKPCYLWVRTLVTVTLSPRFLAWPNIMFAALAMLFRHSQIVA
jgi:hypothetical protein